MSSQTSMLFGIIAMLVAFPASAQVPPPENPCPEGFRQSTSNPGDFTRTADINGYLACYQGDCAHTDFVPPSRPITFGETFTFGSHTGFIGPMYNFVRSFNHDRAEVSYTLCFPLPRPSPTPPSPSAPRGPAAPYVPPGPPPPQTDLRYQEWCVTNGQC